MTSDEGGTLRVSYDVPLEPGAAFGVLVEALRETLRRQRIRFEDVADGRVTQGGQEIGRITTRQAGERLVLEWRPVAWGPEEGSVIELRAESAADGARLIVEHRGWGGLIGEGDERAAWFASEIVAPFVAAAAPAALGDWITDRLARRPTGAGSRAIYRDPLYHYPGFRVLLSELGLAAEDDLLEVGCGGGALLKEALESGCRAAAVDHSPDMVRLAREENRAAVAAGRLAVVEARADRLPFRDAAFTCATMTGVLGFLSDPIGTLAEMRRTLRPGGRLVVAGSDPELRGTPGAPEPMASRLRFYDSAALERLGRDAGFDTVQVIRRDLEPHARAVGVPEEHLPLFSGPGSRFLLARRA